jgi:uncharacterized RDD family membrane protein YckC
MHPQHHSSILSSHKQVRYPSFSARVFASFLDASLLLVLFIPIIMLSSSLIYKGRPPALVMQEIARDHANKNEQEGSVEVKELVEGAMSDSRIHRYLFEEGGGLSMIIDQGLQLLIAAILIICFWHAKGATPGKMAIGLRIVDATTLGPLTWKQCFLRFFGYFPSFFILMIGFFWIRFHKRHQGWHDLLANTLVVKL